MKFKKGQVPWNKGKSPSEETQRKMDEGRKKAWDNPELRKKQSEIMKKAMNNPKTKKKLSESGKGRVPWMKGKKHDDESRKKMSEASRMAWDDPQYRGHMSLVHKGQHSSPKTEFKKGQTPKNKGISPSEESRKKMSIANKGKHHSPNTEFKKGFKHTPERIAQIRQTTIHHMKMGTYSKLRDTKPEKKVKDELINRNYEEEKDFIHQFKFKDKYLCDFCFLNEKLIVEVNGDYWHCNPKIYPNGPKNSQQLKGIEKDKLKEEFIKEADNGAWTYLVLWELDIMENIVKCCDRIEEVLSSIRGGQKPA